jgi:hypothetical protein
MSSTVTSLLRRRVSNAMELRCSFRNTGPNIVQSPLRLGTRGRRGARGKHAREQARGGGDADRLDA